MNPLFQQPAVRGSDQPYHQNRPGQMALEDNLVKANRVRGLYQNLWVAFPELNNPTRSTVTMRAPLSRSDLTNSTNLSEVNGSIGNFRPISVLNAGRVFPGGTNDSDG